MDRAREAGERVRLRMEKSGNPPIPSPPPEAELANTLTTKIDQIHDRYRSRSEGINLLCRDWEFRLRDLGEYLGLDTLEELTHVGTYVTDFFLETAIDETVEIAKVLLSEYPEEPSEASVDAAFKAAKASSIMRPALQRWERLGKELHRRGVEKFGIDAPDVNLKASPSQVDELARQRARKLQRVS